MPDFGRWSANGGDPSLNEINRADRFFEALAAKQPAYPTDHAEAELASLFSAFRDDVRDAPVTAPVSLSDAVEALHGGRRKGSGSRRSLAVVGSVAAAMLCIGGFGTAVYGAGPGDGLYGMRTALFGQHEATRDDQVSLASAQLQQVQQLIDDGQWEEAQNKLVAVSTAVQDVGQVEQKQQLVEQWNALTYKVVEQDPAATLPPGEPLPVLPSSPLTWLPVPEVEQTTTSESSESSTSESSTTSPSETTSSSETTVTSPSDAPGSTTTPSDGSTTTSPSAPTSSSPVAEPPPSSSAAPSSASATTSATTVPTKTTPPSTTTVPSTTTPPSSTTAPTTTTTTTVSRQPEATQPVVAPPVVRPAPPAAELPASAPRVAPSSAVPPAPAAPAQPSQAATTTAPAEATTTTTVVPPG
ncbi:hypothetical protein ASD37_22450 [Mycobacterium sp. Root135]|uniref:anti-sigma-D factor RsdA n=1 Tax=Mycobacterium sp. Root135 TaxID=1736457 RepID=UPI0007007C00|nr:anti-sigma-D factor RsdA [Mycobacterium sp. Root135]KQY04646.1 hypothetical protein ASD37_22450 [Mycobacterium sp. Root135]